MNIIILANVSVLGQIGLVFLGIVIGGIAGFIISRKVFQKQYYPIWIHQSALNTKPLEYYDIHPLCLLITNDVNLSFVEMS